MFRWGTGKVVKSCYTDKVSTEFPCRLFDSGCIHSLFSFKFVGAAAAGELIADIDPFAVSAAAPHRTLPELCSKLVADLIFQSHHAGSSAGGGITVDFFAPSVAGEGSVLAMFAQSGIGSSIAVIGIQGTSGDTGVAVFAEIDLDNIVAFQFQCGENKADTLAVPLFGSQEKAPFACRTQTTGVSIGGSGCLWLTFLRFFQNCTGGGLKLKTLFPQAHLSGMEG